MTATATRLKGSKRAPRANGSQQLSAKPRSEAKHSDDPRGQFGAYLRDWLDNRHGGDETQLAKDLNVSDRTIRKWCEGSHGPAFGKLDEVAKAMGFADWSKLAAAVVKFASV